MDYVARRGRLLENREIDGFLIFDLDRTMPSQMDRPNMQHLFGYDGEGIAPCRDLLLPVC